MIHLLAIAALLFFGGVVCGARAAGFRPKEGWRFPVIALVVLSAFALAGCGHSSSSSAAAAPPPFPSVNITNSPSATATGSGLYDLSVVNSGVTVALSQTIRNLTASNSTITLGTSSSISGVITLTGCTLHVPTSWTGAGNTMHLTASTIVTDVTTALPQSNG